MERVTLFEITKKDLLEDSIVHWCELYTGNKLAFTADLLDVINGRFSRVITMNNYCIVEAYVNKDFRPEVSEHLHNQGISSVYAIVPAHLITSKEYPHAIEVYTPLLNRYFKDRWHYDEDEYNLYLHYPELTITNTLGLSHTIYDLVVRIYITPEGEVQDLMGKRYSFSKIEITKSYNHSHLPRRTNTFEYFCLGKDTPFAKLKNSLESVNSEQFGMFLLSLTSYLQWESIEGNPYISIVDLKPTTQNVFIRSVGSSNSDSYRVLTKVSKIFLSKLIEDKPLLITNKSYDPVLVSTSEALQFELEFFNGFIQSQLTPFEISILDLFLEQYNINEASYFCEQKDDEVRCELPSIEPFEQALLNTLKINRRIVSTAPNNLNKARKRLTPKALIFLIRTVNFYLQQSTTIINEYCNNNASITQNTGDNVSATTITNTLST